MKFWLQMTAAVLAVIVGLYFSPLPPHTIKALVSGVLMGTGVGVIVVLLVTKPIGK